MEKQDLGEWFKASSKLEEMPKGNVRKFIENELRKFNYNDLNRKYEYFKKEKFKMIAQGRYSDPVFEGEVKLPKHLREKDADKKQKSDFGDMES